MVVVIGDRSNRLKRQHGDGWYGTRIRRTFNIGENICGLHSRQGFERVSIERQEFASEAKDKDGRDCFRAPAHFASKILMLKGFAALTSPPENGPDDLPLADPLRDGAIHDLSGKITTLEGRVTDLVSDLASKDAAFKAMIIERDGLIVQIQKLNARIIELTEEEPDEQTDLAQVTPEEDDEEEVED